MYTVSICLSVNASARDRRRRYNVVRLSVRLAGNYAKICSGPEVHVHAPMTLYSLVFMLD